MRHGHTAVLTLSAAFAATALTIGVLHLEDKYGDRSLALVEDALATLRHGSEAFEKSTANINSAAEHAAAASENLVSVADKLQGPAQNLKDAAKDLQNLQGLGDSLERASTNMEDMVGGAIVTFHDAAELAREIMDKTPVSQADKTPSLLGPEWSTSSTGEDESETSPLDFEIDFEIAELLEEWLLDGDNFAEDDAVLFAPKQPD